MDCAICGGITSDWVNMPLDAKKNEVTSFNRLIRCNDCGTGTVEPKPDSSEIAALYVLPEYYTHGGSHMPAVTPTFIDKVLTKLAWWTDRARPFDPAELSGRIGAGAKVLDIGCGSGAMLAEFAALNHDVVGVDPDPDARQEARTRGVRVLAGTGEDLPTELPEGHFDLVVMSHSLEHCIDPLRAIRGARAKVKPGGLLYIEVPNSGCIHFETMLACSENFDSPRHLWFFTAHGMRKMLRQIALQPLEWRYHGLTRHHSPNWRNWETMIAENLRKRGFKGWRRHGTSRSFTMLAREVLAPPLRKYDAVGVLVRA